VKDLLMEDAPPLRPVFGAGRALGFFWLTKQIDATGLIAKRVVIPGPAAGWNPESRFFSIGWIPGSVLRTAPE
jgi:hypothetical protein